ncbi:hypothetical protein [Leptospira broomii]|uniref:hypothetical protein n=1 Tax=Leptospira broomii TaxID=301541 RepID=UPI00028A33FC|nr:hypothetical protein [Leptospira broomii]
MLRRVCISLFVLSLANPPCSASAWKDIVPLTKAQQISRTEESSKFKIHDAIKTELLAISESESNFPKIETTGNVARVPFASLKAFEDSIGNARPFESNDSNFFTPLNTIRILT